MIDKCFLLNCIKEWMEKEEDDHQFVSRIKGKN
jgi:hypothetical protein